MYFFEIMALLWSNWTHVEKFILVGWWQVLIKLADHVVFQQKRPWPRALRQERPCVVVPSDSSEERQWHPGVAAITATSPW